MYGYEYIQQVIAWKLNEEQEPERRYHPAPREIGGETGNDAVYYLKSVVQHRQFFFNVALLLSGG